MVLLMPVMMSYELAGVVLHEIFGIIVFALFISHHVLNKEQIKAVTKGRYNYFRTLNLVINILLSVIMIFLPVSGIIISEHVFKFLHITFATGSARIIHLLFSYWGFVLMSIHAGLHLKTVKRYITKKKLPESKSLILMSIIIQVFVFIYGGYEFYKMRFSDYMFLRSQFVIFDYSKPLALTLFNFFMIMAMFTAIGYDLGAVKKQAKK